MVARLGRGLVLPLLPVLALGWVLTWQVREIATTRAVDDAAGSAELFSRLVIQPQLSQSQLRSGVSTADYARLDASLRASLLGGRVVRFKVWNTDGRVIYSDASDLVGRVFPADEGLESALAGRLHSEVTDASEVENVDERGHGRLLEVYVPLTFGSGHIDGAFELYLPYEPVAAAISHDTHRLYLLILAGLAVLFVALLRIARDGVRLRRHATRNEYLAQHDPLTGLANRALFRERVDAVMRSGEQCAVLFVDLDDFKTVNDSLGHAAGDGLLAEVGLRLQRCIRAGDLVARLGGDEFAVLVDNPATARTVAERIGSALSEPVRVGDQLVAAPASVGIAVAAGERDTDVLLRSADIAMYSAKSSGKGCFQTFQPEMFAQLMWRQELEAGLKAAIEDDQLRLEYQPIRRLDDDQLVAVEALVRWQHPTHGLLGPQEFLPLAESTGLIADLDRWVLATACAQGHAWMSRHGQVLDLHVNVSPQELFAADYVDAVRDILASTGLPADRLVIEVTESQSRGDDARLVAALERLRELGIRIAIDDFGTGQSTLSRLGDFPVDVLKIDRSFVAGIGRDDAASSLTRAVISMGSSLGMAVIAEGIETAEQSSQLRLLGCSEGQGYGLGRPTRPEAIEAELSRRPSRASSRSPRSWTSSRVPRDELAGCRRG